MNLVVVDLEWNQAMSSKSSVFNKLPIHLRGEIIQIGAVKLDESMRPTEEFHIDVRPIYFKRMHYKVKKLTGFDKDRLALGETFADAMEKFREWCGDDVTFLTWGFDDQGIMEQNIIIHDLDWDWIAGWVNLQLIYNLQTDGDKNQKALSTAMEHFEIEQTRVAHDALGDAYNTALVCSHLDMDDGLARYDDAARILSTRLPREKKTGQDGPEPLEHIALTEYASKGEAFADRAITVPECPLCGAEMSIQKWVNQGDQRYMTMAKCPEHGSELVRLKFHRAEDGSYSVTRLIYEADEAMEGFFEAKATQPRRRGKRHSRCKGGRQQ